MAEPEPATPATPPAPVTGLRRSLTFRDLVVYGLLFIAPMAPVGVFGTLDAKSHGVVPLVYAVATVAMGFTAYSYARMVRALPHAGSVYAYARQGLGQGAGFAAGWMMLLDYLLIPAVAYLFSGIAMAELVPAVDQWIWTAGAVLLTTVLNLSGVHTAAVVGLVVLALEIAVLVVFVAAAAVVLAQDGPQRGWLSPFTGDRDFSVAAVFSAVSVAVLSYLGFDAIANFAEEVTGGSRRVAHALAGCLLLAGVLFVLQTYLAALLSADSSRYLARHPEEQGAAFYAAVQGAIGGWLHTTVAASKALGAAFAALAGQAAAGRLLFAMARDGRLPRPLAKVDPARRVPRRALLLSAVITMVAAVWAARTADGLERLVSLVDIGALTGFAMLHLSVIGYFGVRRPRPGPAAVLRDWAVPLLGLAITVAVIATAGREAQGLGSAWLVAGLAVAGVQRVRGRRAG